MALTSIIMMCYMRLVIAHINVNLRDGLDPLQFDYRHKSTADDISMPLSDPLNIWTIRTSMLSLFIDYSSDFNTIIPTKLVSKLLDPELSISLSNWIFGLLICRLHSVRICSSTSMIILNTSDHKALYSGFSSLCNHDCVAKFCSSSVCKFA